MPPVHELRTEADLDRLLAASREEPVALLKHSVACAVSARGRRAFFELDQPEDPPLYLLVVQHARPLSEAVAERLGVRHETPQVLVVRDGEAVFHTSHAAITAEAVRAAIRQAA